MGEMEWSVPLTFNNFPCNFYLQSLQYCTSSSEVLISIHIFLIFSPFFSNNLKPIYEATNSRYFITNFEAANNLALRLLELLRF